MHLSLQGKQLAVFVANDIKFKLSSENKNFEKSVFTTVRAVISQYLKTFLITLVVILTNMIP